MKNKRVFRVNELMTPDQTKELGLLPFMVNPKDDDYFFDYKRVNKFWDEGAIKVFIRSLSFESDSLVFKSRITILGKDYDIFILVDYNENVEFGSEKGPEYVEEFEDAIEGELEYFKDMFEDIYDELIPDDFWEVKSKVN